MARLSIDVGIFSCCSVSKSCLTLCHPKNCSMPGFSVLHCFREFAETHVHWVNVAIQPSHPLSPLSPLAFNLSQHQDIFQWTVFSHMVAKILELQLQHQSFQWVWNPLQNHPQWIRWTPLSTHLMSTFRGVSYCILN